MKKAFIVSERILRAIALGIVIYFLILASAYIFIFEGYDSLDYHLWKLFNDNTWTVHYSGGSRPYNPVSDDIFRVSFIYIFVTSIYRYVRFRKFVWDDLFKWDEYTFAQWDKIGSRILMAFSFLLIILVITGVILYEPR